MSEIEDAVKQAADQIGLAPGESISITLDADAYPDSFSGGYIVTRTDDGSHGESGITYELIQDHTQPKPRAAVTCCAGIFTDHQTGITD